MINFKEGDGGTLPTTYWKLGTDQKTLIYYKQAWGAGSIGYIHFVSSDGEKYVYLLGGLTTFVELYNFGTVTVTGDPRTVDSNPLKLTFNGNFRYIHKGYCAHV